MTNQTVTNTHNVDDIETDVMFFLDSLVDIYGLEPDGERLSISTTHELREKLEQPLKDLLTQKLNQVRGEGYGD